MVFKRKLAGNLRERTSRVLRGVNHLLDFDLLQIERKVVGNARFRVVELDRSFASSKWPSPAYGFARSRRACISNGDKGVKF